MAKKVTGYIKLQVPAGKGTYITSLYLSSTMGPSVRVNPLKF